MRAAVLREFHAPLVLEERPDPEPRGEEVLVCVRGAGVCHTDLHLIEDEEADRPLPLVLGHEIAGEAEGIGEVLVYPAWGCGNCRFCRISEEQLCLDGDPAGFSRDGGYAELVLVPARRYLLPLEGLDPVRAAPLADAGVTPYRVRRIREWLRDRATAVVLGVGGLGQFAVQYVKLLTDARVVAVDIAERKRDRALELGADEARAPEEVDEPARAVLDFVGSDESLALAARVVEQTGIVVQIGAAGDRLPFGLGVWPNGPPDDLDPRLDGRSRRRARARAPRRARLAYRDASARADERGARPASQRRRSGPVRSDAVGATRATLGPLQLSSAPSPAPRSCRTQPGR